MTTQRYWPGIMAAAFAAVLPVAAVAGETGVATWYGSHHEGRRTSSGAVFHQDGMTAASSRLPLGSRVRVTMPDTGHSVVVTVNDRMGNSRALIDLSSGAAKQIGLYQRGRSVVVVEPARDEPLEVAEASEDEASDIVSSGPHDPRHTHHAGRWASAHRPYYHGPSVILARHSIQPRAARRRL